MGIGGVVPITLSAKDVTYTQIDTSFNVINTKDALDKLYLLSQVGNANATNLLDGKEALSSGKKNISYYA